MRRSDDNLVVLSGRLTADSKLQETTNGTSFLNFSVASNEYYETRDGEEKSKVCFVDCVLWGAAAEPHADLLTKGTPVRVTGKIETRKIEDEDTGNSRTFTQVNVSSVYILNQFTSN